jgi:hypothetical protein
MPADPTSFVCVIEPFKSLWQKLRIAGVAVLRDGRWTSISTHITLSHLPAEPDFLIQPTPDFIGFASDEKLSALDDLLEGISTKGEFRVSAGGKEFGIFLKLPPRGPQQPLPQPIIQLGPPFFNVSEEHESSFEFGSTRFRMSNFNIEYQTQVLSYDQFQAISSKLRVHTPPFNGIKELVTSLGAPFDRNQNQTSLDVVAPLPFSLACSDTTVTVGGPPGTISKVRVIGFFDTGNATAQLKPAAATGTQSIAFVCGDIPWPEKSKSGKLFLYFDTHEVGSVSVRRWIGTTNWKIQVQEYFDPGRMILKKGLEARKEQTDFELAVTRLLNELNVPMEWYGDRQYQDRPDAAACIEHKNQWIVILGECTVQKPSVKFTPLLTRKKELEKPLQGEVRVMPVVFTSSTLSGADKKQAREDGIALVGADELAEMLRGVDQEWGAAEVIKYLNGLLTEPLNLSGPWQS